MVLNKSNDKKSDMQRKVLKVKKKDSILDNQ